MPSSCALLGGFAIGARVLAPNAKCQRALVLALFLVVDGILSQIPTCFILRQHVGAYCGVPTDKSFTYFTFQWPCAAVDRTAARVLKEFYLTRGYIIKCFTAILKNG